MKISVVQSLRSRVCGYDPARGSDCELPALRAAAEADMEQAFGLFEQAASRGGDLLVTVETLNQVIAFHDMRYELADLAEPLDGPLIGRFAGLARRHGVYVVAGLLTRRDGRVYNSAVLFDRAGQIAGVFDKVHLPAQEVRVTAGNSYPVFETDFGRLGMLVCWDLQYPEAARALTLAGAELIACPTWGWEKIYGLARAYENGVTLAIAMGVAAGQAVWDGCDPSCIVANNGRVLAEAPRAGAHVVAAEVDIHTGPPLQYGVERFTALTHMRHVRLSQRRPDSYGPLIEAHRFSRV